MARLRDDPPEVIALCLACRHAECDGGVTCQDRLRLMRRLAGKRRRLAASRERSAARMGPRTCLHVTYDGQTLTLAEWARRAGVTYQVVYGRIVRRGEDAGDVLRELLRL